ncbi:dTDP-4-dehydrorhamnose reductase [Kordiimonas gwangyangensis]|uniref:dTDP-4-dehydrorhamnose reductase n=1 Tax=Kordiimonas gwangyangensis TaxID=288022 RepID=UPI0003786EB1|nr:dTDP-4-dehydrorhamnose reductase [Kordiimonas gwangyangensis]
MTRIFVAGKSGQVALSLQEAAAEDSIELVCFGRPELDLAAPEINAQLIRDFAPDAIINAAAYTAVDTAESDEVTATAINAHGPAELARVAHELSVPFLHISTDYVFDGGKDGAYTEEDTVNPQGAYGRSKLRGEEAVMAANPDAMIFRTAWVYSPFGKNFVKTMLTLAESRDTLGVVADQVGNPTYAPDIARALLDVVAIVTDRDAARKFGGIYHLAGSGTVSWHGFASETFKLGQQHGHPVPVVNQLTTAEYPTPAKRPANSQLDCTKLQDTFGITLPEWQASLKGCVDRLFASGTFGAKK